MIKHIQKFSAEKAWSKDLDKLLIIELYTKSFIVSYELKN